MNQYLYNVSDEKLREICVENGFFDVGTNEQYEKLFQLNHTGADVKVLTMVIWACTSCRSATEIENVLRSEMALPIYMGKLRETLMNADYGVQEVEIIMQAVSTHPNAGEFYNVI